MILLSIPHTDPHRLEHIPHHENKAKLHGHVSSLCVHVVGLNEN